MTSPNALMTWLDVAYLSQNEGAYPVSVSVGDLLLAWSHFDQVFALIDSD